MADVREYVEMTLTELEQLPRDKTLFFMPVSPIEVHGPHLPVGTDVFIAEEVRDRLQKRLAETHPDATMINLPPLYCGSDALPVPGSLSVPAEALSEVLLAYARGLHKQGFKYLIVTDNHGGPRHNLGIAYAANQAWKKYRFYVIDPFITIYKLMGRLDPGFIKRTGLAKGTCGDDTDNHAGTNETSLLMACRADYRDRDYSQIPPSLLPRPKGGAAIAASVGRMLGALGGREIAQDLNHLANTLAWMAEKPFTPYMGAPALGSQAAGEAMLAEHARISAELVERALAGEDVRQKPVLNGLRFLRRLPE
jgi:creatinine amidohydrolase/Fe(II)-dependent formamide hydrolase-like protein